MTQVENPFSAYLNLHLGSISSRGLITMLPGPYCYNTGQEPQKEFSQYSLCCHKKIWKTAAQGFRCDSNLQFGLSYYSHQIEIRMSQL